MADTHEYSDFEDVKSSASSSFPSSPFRRYPPPCGRASEELESSNSELPSADEEHVVKTVILKRGTVSRTGKRAFQKEDAEDVHMAPPPVGKSLRQRVMREETSQDKKSRQKKQRAQQAQKQRLHDQSISFVFPLLRAHPLIRCC